MELADLLDQYETILGEVENIDEYVNSMNAKSVEDELADLRRKVNSSDLSKYERKKLEKYLRKIDSNVVGKLIDHPSQPVKLPRIKNGKVKLPQKEKNLIDKQSKQSKEDKAEIKAKIKAKVKKVRQEVRKEKTKAKEEKTKAKEEKAKRKQKKAENKDKNKQMQPFTLTKINGIFRSYVIKMGRVAGHIKKNYHTLLSKLTPLVRDQLKKEIKRAGGVKYSVVLKCRFNKKVNGVDDHKVEYIKSKTALSLENDVETEPEETVKKIAIRIDEFIRGGSGWDFEEAEEANLEVAEYSPLQGGTYIPTPDHVPKRCVLNVQNKDNE